MSILWEAGIALLLCVGAFFGGMFRENLNWTHKWDAEQSARASEVAAAKATNAANLSAAQARNSELVASLAQSTALRQASDAATARSLLDRRTASRPVSASSNQPAAPGVPAVAASDTQLAGAVTAVLDACNHDADQLSALIAEIQPQL